MFWIYFGVKNLVGCVIGSSSFSMPMLVFVELTYFSISIIVLSYSDWFCIIFTVSLFIIFKV
jgi:hypothetical protein